MQAWRLVCPLPGNDIDSDDDDYVCPLPGNDVEDNSVLMLMNYDYDDDYVRPLIDEQKPQPSLLHGLPHPAQRQIQSEVRFV